MKIIAIGDIHGRNVWEAIVARESDADMFVFLGDYFDTRESIGPLDQISNFKKIYEFKRHNPKRVTLLLGNHDYHYLDGVTDRYSGYDAGYATAYKVELEYALSAEFLQVAFVAYDRLLFTHAGVTKTWCDNHNIDHANTLSISGDINDLFSRFRDAFAFQGKNPYGDSVESGPLWVRPLSLSIDRIDEYRQIVGHTQMPQIDCIAPTIRIDTLGTSGEYLEIIGGTTFNIKKI